MKKVLSIILAVLMMAAMATGCGNVTVTTTPTEGQAAGEAEAQDTDGEFPAEEVTIRFATQTMDRETDVVYSILEQFQKDFPNVTLEIEESPGNDLITKINTDVMGDNTPDIFTFWRPEAKWSVDKYVEKGAIADLTEWVESDDFFKDLYPDYAWRTAKTINDTVYCLPRLNFYVEFLVNKDIFDQYGIELPTDWDKLVAACDALKANGIVPWVTDNKEGLDDSSRLFNAIINRAVGNAKGLELLRGTESFQQDDVIQALDYFLAVCKGNAPEDGAVLDYDQAIAKYLNTGKGGMILGNCTQIDRNLDEAVIDSLVALDLPLTPVSVIDAPSTEQDLTNLVYISAEAFADDVKAPFVKELMKRLIGRDAAKRYSEEMQQPVPQLGVEIDESKISSVRKQASALAENCDGDKWLLSYANAAYVAEFRRVIDEAWAGVYETGADLAAALDDAIYGKE